MVAQQVHLASSPGPFPEFPSSVLPAISDDVSYKHFRLPTICTAAIREHAEHPEQTSTGSGVE